MAEESALIVPALEVAHLVEPFRLRHDPSARAGVPPHITVMYPFLEPGRLAADVVLGLDRVLAAVVAFEYELTEVREFEGGVLYLAPEPPEPFMALTQRVADAFDVAPIAARTTSWCPTSPWPRPQPTSSASASPRS